MPALSWYLQMSLSETQVGSLPPIVHCYRGGSRYQAALHSRQRPLAQPRKDTNKPGPGEDLPTALLLFIRPVCNSLSIMLHRQAMFEHTLLCPATLAGAVDLHKSAVIFTITKQNKERKQEAR